MKKLFFFIALFLSVSAFAEIKNLNGVWKSGKIEMTFIKDTLLIDEIDIEGDEYIYTMDSATNIITVKNEFNEPFLIKIVKVTPKALYLYYMDDEKHKVYKFYRKKVQVPTMGF